MAHADESVGQRVRRLREQAGLSQAQLAEKLQVSRPAVSQMEADKRKVTPEELGRLSDLFGVPCDVLLGRQKEPRVVLPQGRGTEPSAGGLRVSVPRKNLDKFREVLLYVLSRVGAKPHVGETVVYKLLYFIDFDYYEKYEEQLIGATYIANRFGPTPVEFRGIVERMEKDGDLTRVRSSHFDYPQRKYLPRREPNLAVLSGRELELIDDVLRRLGDMNATAISHHSHNDVPWLGTESGQPIPYEAVFYRQPPYSQRVYAEEDD